MKISIWAQTYPTVTAQPIDDDGWGVLLETQYGNYRIMERDGALEMQCSNGTISIDLKSANTFGVKVNRLM